MEHIFAVAGNPVLHSLSPEIFNAAFEALGVPAFYTRLAATDGGGAIRTARNMGIRGLNITSPFKEEIIPYLDGLDPHAAALGSVNVVIREGESFKGFNTDFMGVSGAFARHGVVMKGKKAVVLGAGGAAKAAIFALQSAGASVTVINRTFAKAEGLAGLMGSASAPMEALSEEVWTAHILVSCIPFSERIVEPSSLREGLTVLDANYSRETALVRDASALGCRVIDGREWLLAQALPAFTLFTGKEAPEEIMRKILFRGACPRRRSVGLIGFMGSGKSVTGRRLAEATGMAAIDTDEEIEKRTGLAVSEIFGAVNEDGFRTLEAAEVERAVEALPSVISFGGGAVIDRHNAAAMKEKCVSVWLWASPGTILKRLSGDGTRPLLKDSGGLARVEELLWTRIPLYARTADLVIDTDDRPPEKISERICHEIGKSL